MADGHGKFRDPEGGGLPIPKLSTLKTGNVFARSLILRMSMSSSGRLVEPCLPPNHFFFLNEDRFSQNRSFQVCIQKSNDKNTVTLFPMNFAKESYLINNL